MAEVRLLGRTLVRNRSLNRLFQMLCIVGVGRAMKVNPAASASIIGLTLVLMLGSGRDFVLSPTGGLVMLALSQPVNSVVMDYVMSYPRSSFPRTKCPLQFQGRLHPSHCDDLQPGLASLAPGVGRTCMKRVYSRYISEMDILPEQPIPEKRATLSMSMGSSARAIFSGGFYSEISTAGTPVVMDLCLEV